MRRAYLPLILFVLILFASCKRTDTSKTVSSGTYFSVKAYAADQWHVYHGLPFGIIKKIYLDGKADSIITNVNAINWGDILKVFFATDIGDRKYEGQYNFTSFVDSMARTENFYYEANDPKLFTRKLNITASVYSHKITSIYIETARNNKWSTHTQKLFYEPVKSIIIQDYESSVTGKGRELRVEYIFL